VTNASKIKLFVISKNPEPAEARRVQLQGAGYHVTAAGNFRDVQEICEKGDFNLVVVGYSIPAKEKKRIRAELVARCPHTPILELVQRDTPVLLDAQHHLNSQPGTDTLQGKVEEILKSSNGNI